MKYLFLGNRRFVLEELLKVAPDAEIGVIAGSFLERDPFLAGKNFRVFKTSAEIHDRVSVGDFDVLVSNGLPFKLRINELPKRRYVNVHPSYLPDLRGIDPVLGAILFARDAGATCHLMDTGFDTGPIISRVKIEYSDDLRASLLYQLSFLAERQCFVQAHNVNFEPSFLQEERDDLIYFSRKPSTRVLNFSESSEQIVRVVKAFDNRNQGARFFSGGKEYQCHDAWISRNAFLSRNFGSRRENEIVLIYEDTAVIKRSGSFLFLSKIKSLDGLSIGDILM